MYTNGIVKENIEKLSDAGYHFVESEYGELACGVEGPGRFPDIENIIEEVCLVLTKKDLVGQSVLVTAGPTREPLDPVRFISNYSSGKMGYEIAKAAKRRGASVTLVSGPTSLPAPLGIKFIEISSAIEMRDAVMEYLESSTIVIKAAAGADYRPSSYSGSKIKKSEGLFTIPLERNPDIIYEIGKNKGNRIVVGFAMETENTIENARGKMASKNMDLIVANNVNEPGSGFLHDTNIVKIIDREGNVEELPLMNKSEVADRILDRIRGICNGGK
jgi:phosphopantothenoylcysteine decarboxylase/phosphopantothenate--cysteine ligase